MLTEKLNPPTVCAQKSELFHEWWFYFPEIWLVSSDDFVPFDL